MLTALEVTLLLLAASIVAVLMLRSGLVWGNAELLSATRAAPATTSAEAAAAMTPASTRVLRNHGGFGVSNAAGTASVSFQ
jgi:hypothetical protein